MEDRETLIQRGRVGVMMDGFREEKGAGKQAREEIKKLRHRC